MLRRHLLALGAITAVGSAAIGELLELPSPAPVPLPSRLTHVHVGQVRDLTRRLGEADNTCIAGPEVLSAAAAWAERLLGVSGTEPIRRALMVAVAELHIEAGWAGFDAGRYHRAVHHFMAALELATQTREAYLQTTTLNCAGLATVEHGHPNDGLKMLQLSLVKAWDIPRDEQRAVVVGAIGKDDSGGMRAGGCRRAPGTAPGTAGHRGIAGHSVGAPLGRDQPEQSHPLRHRAGHHPHPNRGARDLPLAHGAITAVTKLSSVRVRPRLVPLAARPGTDAKDLSRMAHQVAAVRG
jgi:hypothetical protein